MTLPKFYPIVDSADWVARLLPWGVRFLQVRIKNRPEAEVKAELARVRALCAGREVLWVVNDYWQLAAEAGAPWVHLGQEDLDHADLPWLRRQGLKLGISTHDEDERERALSLAPDYIALGPVYPTTSKKMRWQQQGLARVQQWKARIGTLPLVAIGGMSLERAPGAFAAGADVVSVISDITQNPNPEARVKAWLTL